MFENENKNIRNGLAFIIAVELLVMQYYIPTFRKKEKIILKIIV